MSFAVKKIVHKAKPFIKRLANGNKNQQKSIKNNFEAGFEFALSFYEVGKAHKAEGRPKQTFEQFYHFNNFSKLDFAKKDTDAQTRQQMTEDFVRGVIYPAYNGGYEGNPMF